MRFLPLFAFSAILATCNALADDGAASIAAGGIVMTREPRITMAKEVLFISPGKVDVDYDFRNDTDGDIITEVAFPIPDYEPEDTPASVQGFNDFKLWVDEKPVHYSIEIRALVNGRDYSSLLRSMGVDVQSFGHNNDDNTAPQIKRLNATQKERLRKAGLIDKQFDRPAWKVRKKYYWSQTFPVHATVHIRQEYTPVLGNSNTIAGTLVTTSKADKNDEELASVCPSPDLLGTLRQDEQHPHHLVSIAYVDFILTTANTWKRPIEDFTLNVERPPIDKDPNHHATAVNLVSFCWDGPVERVDANHFRAHLTDFVPTKEVRIGFLQGYLYDY
jgi:hypothetical protein